MTFFALLAILGCDSTRQPSQDHERIAAASTFTRWYSQSRLSAWDVRGHAAGADCGILFVEMSLVVEDSMVDALHYGSGAYDIYPGGVRQFSDDRAFRGVAYRDGSGRVWTYGRITPHDAGALTVCR